MSDHLLNGQSVSDVTTAQGAIDRALAWANGHLSHTNLYQSIAPIDGRVQALAAVEQADAAEVVKWSALAQMLMAEERERWSSRA